MRDETPNHLSTEHPTRRRGRLWQVLVGLSVLVVALIVFASQQGGEDGGDGPLNAIAAAAEKTQGEPGGRATMRAVASSPEQPEPMTITGEMVFDDEDRVQGVMFFPDPKSSRTVKMNLVADGAVIYMSSSLFGSLPDDRDWMALDMASATGMDPAALVPADSDPMAELALLEAAGGPVRKLGKEEVRGVPTTRYRGTISVSENAERMREEGADDLAAYYEKEGSPIKVEAWIDADGLVRRIRVVQSQPGDAGEGGTQMDMRMDFYDFGLEPEIDVPDSDEVFDATDLAREEIEAGGGD